MVQKEIPLFTQKGKQPDIYMVSGCFGVKKRGLRFIVLGIGIPGIAWEIPAGNGNTERGYL